MSDNTHFRINCCIFGQDIYKGFSVKIHPSDNVYGLKKLILREIPQLGSDATDISLFKTNIAVDDFDETLGEALAPIQVPGAQKLSPFLMISQIFDGEPPVKHIHIIVQPLEGLTLYREVNSLVQCRLDYIEAFPADPLSGLARPTEIAEQLDDCFHYSRHPSATPNIPITLIHSVFNNFIDNCENYQPSADDHSFVLDLADKMSQFYPLESIRQQKFIQICLRYGLELHPTAIVGTKFTTDGDMRRRGCIYCLGEIKLDMGAGGAEPVIQAAWYYTSHLKNSRDLLKLDSPLPCLGLYLVGPTLGFFGLAFTDQTNIQILNHPIRFDYHYTDVKQRRTAARYMGAFRRAVQELKEYYDVEIPRLRPHGARSNARFLCYTRYTSRFDMTKHQIEYTSQLFPGKLIFLGKSASSELCVKFVTQYSPEAHHFCASLGVAPTLHAFETLPGGWFMVVMEWVGKEYEPLFGRKKAIPTKFNETFQKSLATFHKGGYVHGDIRDTNVMVRRDGEEGFMLLDFDWSGPIGKAVYPMNINRGPDLWRPEGVSDEAGILAEHDNEMANEMLKYYCSVIDVTEVSQKKRKQVEKQREIPKVDDRGEGPSKKRKV